MRTDPATVRVGTDSSKFPGAPEHDAEWMLRQARALGLDGVFFRSTLDISPTLDVGAMRAAAQLAADLGLYLEAGVGKVNPFAASEAPEIRALGDGDYVAGLGRQIAACAAVGIHEVWAATANYKFGTPGLWGYDRFRTDTTWAEQLAATAKVLRKLEPVLAEHGSHLNIETHEEITTFEVVRLVEEAGPHAFGITFDTANVLCRTEDPVAAARRVAPYARQSHVRDAALFFTDDGVSRFLAPCGQGVIAWPRLLAALLERAPRMTLSIEGIMGKRWQMPIPLLAPEWDAAHRDLTLAEMAEIHRLTHGYTERVRTGDAPDADHYRREATTAERLAFITSSVAFLREALAGLAAPAPG